MHRTSLVSIVVRGRLLWAQPEALDKGAVEQAIKTIVDHDCVSTTDKYRAEEPWYLWYCGTKTYRKGDGTGTV